MKTLFNTIKKDIENIGQSSYCISKMNDKVWFYLFSYKFDYEHILYENKSKDAYLDYYYVSMSGKNIEKYVRFLFDELKIKWIYKQIFDKERLCISTQDCDRFIQTLKIYGK